jgi:hypothetical protein
MEPFMTADWGQAVDVAIQAIHAGGEIPDEVPQSVAAAARTLLYEPIELSHTADNVCYVNGQHRSEAMLRQGVEETVLRDTRLIAEPPLPEEISQVGVSS